VRRENIRSLSCERVASLEGRCEIRSSGIDGVFTSTEGEAEGATTAAAAAAAAAAATTLAPLSKADSSEEVDDTVLGAAAEGDELEGDGALVAVAPSD